MLSGDLPLIEHHHPVGKPLHVQQQMAGQQDADALTA